MKYSEAEEHLKNNRYVWLVTGAAGFIGSHLCERLLSLRQIVYGMDDFSTGRLENMATFVNHPNFIFYEEDINDIHILHAKADNIAFVLHQAAKGSVPRSILEPDTFHESNVDGFFGIIKFFNSRYIKKFVYASSSSVYGDRWTMQKIENRVGNVLSPYAATKAINELYAQAFYKAYDLPAIGLRYFNVFGPRQNPDSEYSAVIPRWIKALKENKPTEIYGDGTNSRDFCFIENVVRANIQAAFAGPSANGECFNIGCGQRTDLNTLHELIRQELRELGYNPQKPQYADLRKGDVANSIASIDKARRILNYEPVVNITEGLKQTIKGSEQ